MRTSRLALVLAFFAAFAAHVRSVRADVRPVDTTRLVVVGGGPLTGFVETDVGTVVGETTVRSRSDAAGLVGLQIEIPILPYLTLVGRGSAIRYHYTTENREHRTFFDLGVAPTFTFAIDAGRLRLEPRVGVPVGVSLHLANADAITDLDRLGERRTNAGWHVGALIGLHVGASGSGSGASRVGGFVELGYLHHRAYGSWDGPGPNDAIYELRVDQLLLQLGLSLAL